MRRLFAWSITLLLNAVGLLWPLRCGPRTTRREKKCLRRNPGSYLSSSPGGGIHQRLAGFDIFQWAFHWALTSPMSA